MGRQVLADVQVHPEALKSISENHKETITGIISAIEKNKIVVIGMAGNPFVKKARKTLEKSQMEYTYLEYGGYFSEWKQRLAIKLWSGWTTYPQVFIDGKLVGGASDLETFLKK